MCIFRDEGTYNSLSKVRKNIFSFQGLNCLIYLNNGLASFDFVNLFADDLLIAKSNLNETQHDGSQEFLNSKTS